MPRLSDAPPEIIVLLHLVIVPAPCLLLGLLASTQDLRRRMCIRLNNGPFTTSTLFLLRRTIRVEQLQPVRMIAMPTLLATGSALKIPGKRSAKLLHRRSALLGNFVHLDCSAACSGGRPCINSHPFSSRRLCRSGPSATRRVFELRPCSPHRQQRPCLPAPLLAFPAITGYGLPKSEAMASSGACSPHWLLPLPLLFL